MNQQRIPVTNSVSRRGFVRRAVGTAGSIILGAGGNWALAAPKNDVPVWSFPLLGDLHFDRPDHHDIKWLTKEHPHDVSQVERYCRISAEMTPKLLAVVRQQAKESPGTVPFVVQLGDLVEGLCGSENLATRQANDAIDLIRRTEFPVPFLFTKGNHDVTGPGAAQVYDEVLVPFMAKQAGKEIEQAVFTRERDGILLVFYDAYNRDSLDWFTELMDRQRPRRLLFVIHPPVVPYNARSTWHIYSHPRQEQQRQRLLGLLGQARAIVFSGHLHKYSFLVRRTETGRFVQLGLSSVASSEDGKPRNLIDDLNRYGPDLVKLEPKHSPETEERRRQVLELERPFIERFEYAETWGHALVSVQGDQVRASVFQGLDRRAWKSLDLTKALGGSS